MPAGLGVWLKDEIPRVEVGGVRRINLHLGIGIGVGGDEDHGVPAAVGHRPDKAAPVAGVICGIGEEGEGLIAGHVRISVDRREVNLVLALREIGDVVDLGDAVDHDILRTPPRRCI